MSESDPDNIAPLDIDPHDFPTCSFEMVERCSCAATDRSSFISSSVFLSEDSDSSRDSASAEASANPRHLASDALASFSSFAFDSSSALTCCSSADLASLSLDRVASRSTT